MNKLEVNIGFISIAWDVFDVAWAEQMFNKSREKLAEIEANIIAPNCTVKTEEEMAKAIEKLKAENIDCLLVQNGTFAWGGHIVNLAKAFGVPFFLWALPEPEKNGKLRSNSLCGVTMNSNALYKLGKYYKYFYAAADDNYVMEHLRKAVKAIRAAKMLKSSKIGLVGYRVPGFYGSTFDELSLRKELGAEIKHISFRDIKSEIEKVSKDETDKIGTEIRSYVNSINMSNSQAENYFKICCGFRKMAENRKVDALAVKCWPDAIDEFGMNICAVMSKLTNDGLITGCEADMYGTVTMLIQYYITGEPPFIVDFVRADTENNTGVLWHCGNAPFSLAGKKSEIKIDAPGCSNFGCKGGAFTLAKLSYDNGFKMLLAKGEAIDNECIYKGTTSLVKFNSKITNVLDTIIYNGFEHHFSVAYADITEEMKYFAAMSGIKVIEI